jgi:UDP-2-acetamido-2,6-beta-L-arabino-hexul-4-ose reductase
MKKVCITGADGFIGKNLLLYLSEFNDLEVLKVTRYTTKQQLEQILLEIDVVIHLAGVNRPTNESEFVEINTNLTKSILDFLVQNNRKVFFILSSSTQAEIDNPYGISKKQAENLVLEYKEKTGSPVKILRLPGVFGKFCKPSYNSVVATFCYNISRNIEIQIHDPEREIQLVYIDSVVSAIVDLIYTSNVKELVFIDVNPIYKISLGELARNLFSFSNTRKNITMDNVGNGFLRALYATFISYLPTNFWSYKIPKYSDSRGDFVEMLKTKESGQFSYFTAPPGTTRGEHYHHTKTEKFLVIKGHAKFRFCNMISKEFYEIIVKGENPEIVDTIPGWAHDITNIGSDDMIVMLWANEIFNRESPDTFSCKVLA